MLEGDSVALRRVLVGLDRQITVREVAVAEVILVRFGRPRIGVPQAFRHVGDHFDEHHHLVEMIEVVGRQQRLLIDVCAADQPAEGAGIGDLGARHLALRWFRLCDQRSLAHFPFDGFKPAAPG